jgi:hypothetical protein
MVLSKISINFAFMKTMCFTFIVAILGLAACSSDSFSHSSVWEEMPVVAHIEEVNGDTLTVAHLDQLKDTVRIPLSDLVEKLQIVALDNKEEALVDEGRVTLSDHYILVPSYKTPCKLFRKDGTFVGKVGNIGQGMGEYKIISDAQIDETKGKIYLLPWNSKAILMYNLEGKFEKAIPLHAKWPKLFAPKGVFQVNTEKDEITMVSLPFHYLPHVAWVQDMEGNRIHEIPIGHWKLKANYSNEVHTSKATDALSFHIVPFFELRQDSLYHWDNRQKRMVPRFTLDFGKGKIGWHNYSELPLYYFGQLAGTKQMTEDSYVSDQERFFIIDKATLKGGYCHIYNDYLCDEPSDWIVGQNGYFIENVTPDVLQKRIEDFLKESTSISKERKERLLALKAGIHENSNNYIIYGKHRTRK